MNESCRINVPTSTSIKVLGYEDVIINLSPILDILDKEAGFFASDDALARAITFVHFDSYPSISKSNHSGVFAPEEVEVDRILAQERMLNAALERISEAMKPNSINFTVAQPKYDNLITKFASMENVNNFIVLQSLSPLVMDQLKSAPDMAALADRSRPVRVAAETLSKAEAEYRELDRARTLLQRQMDVVSVNLRLNAVREKGVRDENRTRLDTSGCL